MSPTNRTATSTTVAAIRAADPNRTAADVHVQRSRTTQPGRRPVSATWSRTVWIRPAGAVAGRASASQAANARSTSDRAVMRSAPDRMG